MNKPIIAPHYRWQDLAEDHPMALLSRRRVIGVRMMLSQVHLQQGCSVPTHSHENEQLAVIVSGALRFGIGDEGDPTRYEIVVRGGEVLHLPSNVPHSALAMEDTVVLDVFCPPSQKTGIDDAHS